MSDPQAHDRCASLVYEYTLDAPPEKVWRAISIPALREHWLPALAQAESLTSRPGEEVTYRLRDDEPPYLESTVTLQIRPRADGGTALRIVHDLTDPRLATNPEPAPAANDRDYLVMRAA